MLRGEDTVGSAEQGVAAGGEDGELVIVSVDREIDLGADRTADPVALHFLGAFRPVDFLETFEQAVSIGYDVDDPLTHVLADDREAAAFALAVDDFIVGENCTKLFTPVDRHIDTFGQTVLKQKFEDVLRPFVIGRIAGRDLLFPVIGKADVLQLVGEECDILLGESFRMVSGVDRILLRRKTEGVKSHRMQDVVAFHPLFTGNDIRCRIAFRMADMQALSGRIREHIENIILWF